MMKLKRKFPLILLSLCALNLAACSTNPATGRAQFAALMSEDKEKQVGASEHPNIVEQYGLYDDAKIANYVQEIGAKITKYTERPNIEYKFYVIDSPIVNAFALPGGYIYASRGLLALANSEAELAAVLAHEAGHITGRHSAERYSRSVVASLGVNLLASGIDQPGVAQALGLGSQLYLSSYSRTQENEADTLGIRYLSRAAYDPVAMPSFLSSLKRSSDLEARMAGASSGGFSYFSTHPATQDRVNKTLEEQKSVINSGAINRDQYLDMINGLVYGDSAKQGFVRGQSFIHPEIGFAFDVPAGFHIANQSAQVVATSKSGAVIVFDMASRTSGMKAVTYLQNVWMKDETIQNIEGITVNGMAAATASTTGNVNGQQMTIRLVAIEFGAGRFARFMIGIPSNPSQDLVDGLKRSSYSFRELSVRDRQKYRPYRLRLVSAKAGDTVESMAALFPYDSLNAERFIVLNGLSSEQSLIVGQRYKIISK